MSYIENLGKAKSYREEVYKIISNRSTNSDREKVVAGYLSLTIQHFSGIILLIENSLFRTAFTLIRPIYDTVYRGTWLTLIATDEQISTFMSGNLSFKNTYKLAKEIDNFFGDTVFHDKYEKDSTLLHGFTHSGIEIIGKQFNEEGSRIEQSFENLEIELLIDSICSNLGMMLLAFSKFQDDKKMQFLAKKMIGCK